MKNASAAFHRLQKSLRGAEVIVLFDCADEVKSYKV